MTDRSFSIDVAAIRHRARANMAAGAVTESYGQDRRQVAAVLNDALATEIVCWLRYTRHAISATGINRAQVSAEFSEHAEEERGHAMRIAERINELGGEPDFNPTTIATRAHTTYETTADDDLASMLRENLAAERIVISTYQEVIRWLGNGDITTRRLMESILDEEERHANDILDLLGSFDGGPQPGTSPRQ
jgi:bacterioferritin